MRRLASLVFALAVLASLAPGAASASAPATVGVVGCSNTQNALTGYEQVSTKRLLWAKDDTIGNGSTYSGKSISEWSAPGSVAWDIFDAALAAHPETSAIWWELCVRAGSGDTNATVDAIVSLIRQRLPNVPIYASALDATPGCGVGDPARSQQFVDYLVAKGSVERGPVMTALTSSQTDAGGCHANDVGKPIWGQDLVDFFDLGIVPPPATGTFADVPSTHTFYADIEWLAAEGITKGCNPPDNTLFCPDDSVTRGQMAAFLVRALHLPAAGSAGFADTSGSTFEDDIDRLAAAGITKGCNPPTNDLFCPNDYVTRGQMAAFLARALNLPAVSADTAWTAEVLNLTRNVRIEGTPSGRTHIHIHSSVPQSIKYMALRYFGPRGFALAQTEDGVGRYGVHFHHCKDGSRGSIVEGVVVRDGGNHAFVPHASHGITMRDCISYNTNEDAYWWDEHVENASNNVVWERCVAALVNHEDSDGYRLAGFALMASEDPHDSKTDPNVNTIRDCVAVGVNGARDSAGIVWPEFASGAVWEFSGNVSHNNSQSGIFTWQNDGNDHDNHDFVCYHNGAHGINHGAYVNAHRYSNGVLYGNGVSGIYLRSANIRELGKTGNELSFTNMVIDGAGISDHCVTHGEHTSLPPLIRKPIVFTGCVLTGSVGSKVYVTNPAQGGGSPANLLKDRWDFVDCGLTKSDVVVTSDADPDALVRVQNGSTAFEVDSTGTRDIPAFA